MTKQLVTEGQTEILAVTTAAPVVTFRIPRPKEVDPFFGGSRTFWLQLVLRTKGNGFKSQVESVVVKQPGAKRGMRFVVFESAAAYFQKLRATQPNENLIAK